MNDFWYDVTRSTLTTSCSPELLKDTTDKKFESEIEIVLRSGSHQLLLHRCLMVLVQEVQGTSETSNIINNKKKHVVHLCYW